jgi:F420-non-reducing hydrogenase small subunit
MKEKPKLAIYWASSCGGCEISVVNLHEKILDVDRNFDFVFCPCLLDTKERDVEAMSDGAIAVTLFNGAIRNDHNECMARLLRRKSRLLVAYGSCSGIGSIPAMSNWYTREEHFSSIYAAGPSLDNPGHTKPEAAARVPEGELTLPVFHDTVRSLDQVVRVDYFIPGCPPESHQAWNVIDAIIREAPLPPPGSLLGAGTSSVCQECPRTKSDKRIKKLHRTFEVIPDATSCLLEQGLVCMGIATRDGCGARCPQVNMPCVGCYGPPEGVRDQGAKMIAALGSIFDPGDYKDLDEAQLGERTQRIIEAIPDPGGTFYKFSMAGSILRRRRAGCSESP